MHGNNEQSVFVLHHSSLVDVLVAIFTISLHIVPFYQTLDSLLQILCLKNGSYQHEMNACTQCLYLDWEFELFK